MKSFKYYISSLLLVGSMGMGLSSCSEDDLSPDTIFPEVDETLDPTSATYQLDKFLRENYLEPYNLEFLYKMKDVSSSMSYNLVPATYENSVDLAVLTKYLWFDAYAEVVGEDFLKSYGPRVIHLIGSPAYNPSSGSMILGLAEGGVKVSLFRVNSMQIDNFDQMNEYYFKTMHHEFSHILHQTKTYPSEFNTLSVGRYDSNNWQDRQDGVCASWGFVSTYASSAYREDFAETIANYIVKTDAQWASILDLARRGWATPSADGDTDAIYYCYYYTTNNSGDDADKQYCYATQVRFALNDDGTVNYMYLYGSNQTGVAPITRVGIDDDGDGTNDRYEYRDANNTLCDAAGYVLDGNGARVPIYVFDVADTDGIDGVEIIEQKVQIARQWLADEWGVDLDALRECVQRRQTSYDINELRKQVYEIQ